MLVSCIHHYSFRSGKYLAPQDRSIIINIPLWWYGGFKFPFYQAEEGSSDRGSFTGRADKRLHDRKLCRCDPVSTAE